LGSKIVLLVVSFFFNIIDIDINSYHVFYKCWYGNWGCL